MKLQLLIPISFLLVALSAAVGCSCTPPNVNFDVAAKNVKSWVVNCLDGKGESVSGLWSFATGEAGKKQCSFLPQLKRQFSKDKDKDVVLDVSVLSVEDRTSLFCAKTLWVFLSRSDNKKGFLLVSVANLSKLGTPSLLLTPEPDVVLFDVGYGFCSKPDTAEQFRNIESCFWQSP